MQAEVTWAPAHLAFRPMACSGEGGGRRHRYERWGAARVRVALTAAPNPPASRLVTRSRAASRRSVPPRRSSAEAVPGSAWPGPRRAAGGARCRAAPGHRRPRRATGGRAGQRVAVADGRASPWDAALAGPEPLATGAAPPDLRHHGLPERRAPGLCQSHGPASWRVRRMPEHRAAPRRAAVGGRATTGRGRAPGGAPPLVRAEADGGPAAQGRAITASPCLGSASSVPCPRTGVRVVATPERRR